MKKGLLTFFEKKEVSENAPGYLIRIEYAGKDSERKDNLYWLLLASKLYGGTLLGRGIEISEDLSESEFFIFCFRRGSSENHDLEGMVGGFLDSVAYLGAFSYPFDSFLE